MDLSDKWNEGKIEVNINRCVECIHHFNYSRHSEDEFINTFNEIGDAILGIFPNAVINGNYEKPQFLGEFEVYLRGAGFKSHRDSFDRFYIFKKSQKGRFPERSEIIDKLICIVLLYGDSNKMADEQEIAKFKLLKYPPSIYSHSHPCEMPEKIKK